MPRIKYPEGITCMNDYLGSIDTIAYVLVANELVACAMKSPEAPRRQKGVSDAVIA